MNECILVVDDDPEIVRAIAILLEKEGYQVLKAYNGMEALEQAVNPALRLIVIDVMMPKLDGLSAVMKIREKRNLPIIVLSAKSEDSDKVLGLSMGADDYIAKPFGMMELMARIRTALRHSGGEAEPVHALTLGPLRIDPARHQVLAHGREVTLTLKEFQLLSLLVEHAGTVFTRDQLLNTIWGYEFDGASRTVDVHVRTLRQKLGEAGRCIETVRGVGYKAESDPSKSEEQP